MTVMRPQEGKIFSPGHTRLTTSHAPDHSACAGISEVLARVGDKWSVLVVMELRDGSRRFNELKRAVTGISQNMLTHTLRGLERDGLVTRTQFQTIPPRVDYDLTPLGHSLRVPVEALGSWAIANRQAINEAQRIYDARVSED